MKKLVIPLPNGMNIIVSLSANYSGENLVTVEFSSKEAIEAAGDANIYVCGGYGLFMEAIL